MNFACNFSLYFSSDYLFDSLNIAKIVLYINQHIIEVIID
jgi:hypothetical protein